jgi:hypothetical protein
MKFCKVINLEDFDSSELLPFLNEIISKQSIGDIILPPRVVPDSEHWKMAMSLFSLNHGALLKQGKILANIRSDPDPFPFLLAKRGPIVMDVYDQIGQVGSAANPHHFNHLHYSHVLDKQVCPLNIIPLISDRRAISLPTNFVDGVSCGSLRYFQDLGDLSAFAYEIARILKPGGLASLCFDYFLDGPDCTSSSGQRLCFFDYDRLERFFIAPSGLEKIGSIDFQPSPGTYGTRKEEISYLQPSGYPNRHSLAGSTNPNLIHCEKGILHCSAHVLLRKPQDWRAAPHAGNKSDLIRKEISCSVAAKVDVQPVQTVRADPPRAAIRFKRVLKILILRGIKLIDAVLIKIPRLRRMTKKIIYRVPKLRSFLSRNPRNK